MFIKRKCFKKDLFLPYIMIKLGDYCEDDAKDLITSLRKARVKCDTRINFVIDHFKVDCIEGRLSELREVLKDTQK